VSSSPFSSLPLSSESLTILPHLEQLTKRGWWTVCSQPAVDGAPSTDQIFGWGPRGGYVFQKGFVEFFVEEDVLDRIEKKVAADGGGWVHYFAANLQVSMPSNIAPSLQTNADYRENAEATCRMTAGTQSLGACSRGRKLPRRPSLSANPS